MTRPIAAVAALIVPVNAAALILHHVGKGAAREGSEDQEAARGASSISASARWQGHLVTMGPDDAADRGVSDEDRKRWVRWTVSKINRAMPPPDRWMWKGAGGVLVGREPPAKRPKPTKTQALRARTGGARTGGGREFDD